MKCPNDDTTLAISDRQGVEIDYCPTCRGVWLDRGELDKLIERANAAGAAPQRDERRDYSDDRRDRDYDDRRSERRHDDDDDYRHHGNDHHRKHKKEGFLGDIFDF